MRLCSIASGSSGNCIYVGSDKTHLLVDAGISGKKVEFGLNSLDLTTGDLDGILVTHEHSDHIKGLGVVARKCGVPIYATQGTIRAMENSGSLGKMPEGIFHEVTPDQDCPIGDLTIHPFRISHDAAEPVAYRIGQGDREVGIATDMGVYDEYIVKNLEGLDALLLEANHDVNMLQVGKYPYYLKRRILGDKGHLSNETAGQLLCRLLHDNMKQILLGHLSRENNYEALAYETVCAEVTMGDNPYKAKDFQEYWQRWHMTLSRFLSSYIFRNVYRRGVKYRNYYVASMCTFFVSGFWHGAGWTFVVWGIVNGILVCIASYRNKHNMKTPLWLGIPLTFILAVFVRVLFVSNTFTDAWYVLRGMFNFSTLHLSAIKDALMDNWDMWLLNLFGLAICWFTPTTKKMTEHFKPNWKYLLYAATLLVICLLNMDKVVQFLYFQF